MVDTGEYESLARESGAYRDIEFEMLKEMLAAWKTRPGNPYTALELRDGKLLAGFALFARAPNTDFTYDIHALCVDPAYRSTAAGLRLIEMIEEEALRADTFAIIRCEISARKAAAVGEGLFDEAGYSLIGHIPNFYERGDDYFMYARHITRSGRAGAGSYSAAADSVAPDAEARP